MLGPSSGLRNGTVKATALIATMVTIISIIVVCRLWYLGGCSGLPSWVLYADVKRAS